jgi:hypothetical protein
MPGIAHRVTSSAQTRPGDRARPDSLRVVPSQIRTMFRAARQARSVWTSLALVGEDMSYPTCHLVP